MRNILFIAIGFFSLSAFSYDYYATEKANISDPEEIGFFIPEANKTDLLKSSAVGKGKKVVLDYYFNNEYKKDEEGHLVRFHYTWEDKANTGFSYFGNIFQQSGAIIESLKTAPTRGSLQSADIYIIVDPDTEKETSDPHFVTPRDVGVIYNWVKSGGVLLLMGNDSANAEFLHFNQLAEKFGIHFNEDRRNHVTGNHFEMGAFSIKDKDPIFRTTKKIFIKDISTLRIQSPAKAYLSQGGDIIMALSHVGKGTVFAVGDPWFYNEYVDGRNLPAEYENAHAAKDLAEWLLLQSKKAPLSTEN